MVEAMAEAQAEAEERLQNLPLLSYSGAADREASLYRERSRIAVLQGRRTNFLDGLFMGSTFVSTAAVLAGVMTSVYGYYFWPTLGDGFLLNTIASVFLGGTSVFGGTGSIVGSFVASYIIGAINAGIVSAGINAFYTQLCFGLVIVLSVVLQTVIERRIRRQSLTGR